VTKLAVLRNSRSGKMRHEKQQPEI
jgi:hypothetical protein